MIRRRWTNRLMHSIQCGDVPVAALPRNPCEASSTMNSIAGTYWQNGADRGRLQMAQLGCFFFMK
jgi:hypothetical protein